MYVNVRVVTQVWENYGFADGGKDHWKPKGSQVFNMPLDHSVAMYGENIEQAIQTTLDNVATQLYKYDLIDHEIEIKEPITLDERALGNAMMLNSFREKFGSPK